MTWQDLCDALIDDLPEGIYDLWIKPLRCVQFEPEVVKLEGPDRFFCNWVADQYLADITKALVVGGMTGAEVVFTLVSGNATSQERPATRKSEQGVLPCMPQKPLFVRTLNPRYVFDEFVVGSSNEEAHFACQALAEGDVSFGGCLYLNSETGLGKSHLSHAVAHHLLSNKPGTRLNFLTAQQLTSEMFRAIQAKSMESFKEKFQSSDVLLIEDVQSLSGRIKTQEELGNLLDYLLEAGKAVVFTGSRPPKDIDGLSSGVRSRLSSGLITTIAAPDLETRTRIIDRSAKTVGLDLNEELSMFLADMVKGDVRQIKSAIVGLKTKSSVRRMQPDIEMIKEVLAAIVAQSQSLTPEAIRDFIAEQFNVSGADLQTKSRRKAVAFPRQVSMYFARKFTEMALSEIGLAFKRDHSTVVHSIRKINGSINRDGSVRGQIELLDKKLRDQFLSF